MSKSATEDRPLAGLADTFESLESDPPRETVNLLCVLAIRPSLLLRVMSVQYICILAHHLFLFDICVGKSPSCCFLHPAEPGKRTSTCNSCRSRQTLQPPFSTVRLYRYNATIAQTRQRHFIALCKSFRFSITYGVFVHSESKALF